MSNPAEQTNERPTAPPAKRKYTRRTRHTAKQPAALKVPDEFAGMTEIECCSACNAERCVISSINVCGHPFKGGQIPPGDGKALARSLRAKKVLAHHKIDLGAG